MVSVDNNGKEVYCEKGVLVFYVLFGFMLLHCVGGELDEEGFTEDDANSYFNDWEEEDFIALDENVEVGVQRDELRATNGLPGGCHGRERRYTMGRPSWYGWVHDSNGWHFKLMYYMPRRNWCHISHLSRVNTDWCRGGADNWTAALHSRSYGYQLDVYVPGEFVARYINEVYHYGTWRVIADKFFVWAYHE